MHSRGRSFFFVFLLICGLAEQSFAQCRASTIPSPKEQGQGYYVSNPARILDAYTVDSLNRLAGMVDRATSAELAVVVVDDFEGDNEFQFALDLFNTWGIGKAGASNGLLLFVSTEKRAYRFITGYGMEAVLPDVLLKRIGETLLLPRFREGDYDGGILAGMEAVKTVVLNPNVAGDLQRNLEHQDSFFYKHSSTLISSVGVVVMYLLVWKLASRAYGSIPTRQKRKRKKSSAGTYLLFSGIVFFICAFLSIFVIAFLGMPSSWLYNWSYLPLYVVVFFGLAIAIMYGEGLSLIGKSFMDSENRLRMTADFNKRMALPMLAAPFTWILLYGMFQRRKTDRLRLVPPEGEGWQRIDRDKQRDVNRYLDRGQQQEEKTGSVAYEIWTRNAPGGIHPVAFPAKGYSKFSQCPSCGYRTFSNIFTKILKRPTVINEGSGERLQTCSNCKHSVSHGTVVLERTRPVSSSSSSSGGSSSGSSGSSGGSSSSGGSWGGGSSGGGGAGGRW